VLDASVFQSEHYPWRQCADYDIFRESNNSAPYSTTSDAVLFSIMADLKDLAALLGIPEPDKNTSTAKANDKRRGHDGNVLRLRVRVEKRRGKPVSIAWGFFSHPMELNRLLTLFKKTLGAGGQLVDQTIEMQGDHVARMKNVLEEEGYKVG